MVIVIVVAVREKKALEVCSMGSRSTPKTPMGKDLHASLYSDE